MLTDMQLKNIKEKFTLAAQTHGLQFISPYCLDSEADLWVFGHLYKTNIYQGCYFDIIDDFDEQNKAIMQYCSKKKMFYSCIFSQPLETEYNQTYFNELFDDWEYNL